MIMISLVVTCHPFKNITWGVDYIPPEYISYLWPENFITESQYLLIFSPCISSPPTLPECNCFYEDMYNLMEYHNLKREYFTKTDIRYS